MKLSFLFFLLKLYLNVVVLTCSIKVHNPHFLQQALKQKRPVMLSFWHERLVFLACYFKNWGLPIWALSSKHRDSELLGLILKSWGFKLIKGSSSRGWLSATKELVSLFKDSNTNVAITHDGPKGPPRMAKPGSLKIAIKNNVSILCVSGSSSSCWTLNTWDKIKLPKPFCKIHISFAPLYLKGNDIKVFNDYLNKNQDALDEEVGFVN